jgi:hypothetical protein
MKFMIIQKNTTVNDYNMDMLISTEYMVSLLLLVLFMMWALANQFLFLFTNNGFESTLFKRPYNLGDAP